MFEILIFKNLCFIEEPQTYKHAYINTYIHTYRDAGKKVGQGGPTGAKSTATLGQQIYLRNGGNPRHFLGNVMGYASHSQINDCLFQSNITCF